ncbi:hypothetical protein AruPA_17425 [Acidiphilium sp. PA]|uniref:plasmid mobilization protein n=1 Tax=Acidiphilium sp. PA TaxID=2871705 RepID=UPI0022447D8C|nr:hypothetical protein [Acidiphilium sp. PA]MCW8308818.1 hypothetical protein [Acidiphilium sp. PA]
MSAVVNDPSPSRTTRMSALVSDFEAAEIARRASAAGLSVSAYLRERALDLGNNAGDADALRQVDRMIDKMTADVDNAIGVLATTLRRMKKA